MKKKFSHGKNLFDWEKDDMLSTIVIAQSRMDKAYIADNDTKIIDGDWCTVLAHSKVCDMVKHFLKLVSIKKLVKSRNVW